jgi:hypothetical protein
MPEGKAAGKRCIQLDDNNLCLLFGQPERPKVCAAFGAEEWVCGTTNEQALMIISDLEESTGS